MAELDPPDDNLPPAAAPLQQQSETPQPDNSLGKRQRRPSVRLGEIGDQPPDEPSAARTKHWRLPKDSSKTRPLANLVLNADEDRNFSGEGHSDFGSRKLSSKKATLRRARTNWSDAFEADGSDRPFKDLSPVHSIDNDTLNFWNRRAIISDNELENMPESDSRDRKCDSCADGVRDWLIGLGLGRYAPVFEIHEVDDEVLPLLTLDDLKDMGINAVGSRRKMYTAIQKLRKGFS